MTRQNRAVIVAARRTAVCPRGGALSAWQADELAAPVLEALLQDAELQADQVDHVILGNALYAGGNPARMAALRAGIPQAVPAVTLDTQCCSGMDAILFGARLIEAGAANYVIAGGAESFSRAPIRMHRSLSADGEHKPYDRPAFAPLPFSDPDLAASAAELAEERQISRAEQVEFAVHSHQKAIASQSTVSPRLVSVSRQTVPQDTFTRRITSETAMRAPVLQGTQETGLSAATIACEADAAAAVVLVSEAILETSYRTGLLVYKARSIGGNPACPALAPIALGRDLLDGYGISEREIFCVELMEAYAVQAMVTAQELGLTSSTLNPLGGALARGHPIGASGTILAVNLFEKMLQQKNAPQDKHAHGLALIAAAGGLASGLVVENWSR